jgi:DNA processing protein
VNVTSKLSWGHSLLIKQGAKLVQDFNDVIVELAPHVRRRLVDDGRGEAGSTEADQAALFSGPTGGTNRAVLGRLKADASVHLDQLVEEMEETSPSELIAALFELEMMALVRQLPGKNFVKVW